MRGCQQCSRNLAGSALSPGAVREPWRSLRLCVHWRVNLRSTLRVEVQRVDVSLPARLRFANVSAADGGSWQTNGFTREAKDGAGLGPWC